MKENYCDKEAYTKQRAERVRSNIYQNKKRKIKLRIYQCPHCHMYHLTSSVGLTYPSD